MVTPPADIKFQAMSMSEMMKGMWSVR